MRNLSRPSRSMVVAGTALFLAIGGSGYAASNPNPIHARAASHSKRGPAGPRGPRGFRGRDGQQGSTGPAGPAGSAGAGSSATNSKLVRQDITVPPNANGEGIAVCPSGQVAVGGGVGASALNPDDRVVQSAPLAATGATETGTTPVRWFGRYHNGGIAPETAYVFAICAS